MAPWWGHWSAALSGRQQRQRRHCRGNGVAGAAVAVDPLIPGHKQILKLKDVVVNSNVRCLSLDELRNNIVVCDGGATDSDAIKDT